jgi:hypothetical protein
MPAQGGRLSFGSFLGFEEQKIEAVASSREG